MAAAAAAIAAGVLLFLVFSLAREGAYARRLPRLPELSREPAALRTHLTQADRAAREDPTSADRVGALGLAYHANMFYEEADRCYAIAEALSDSPWRWTYHRALVREVQGDTDDVAAALRRVVEMAPDFSPAWWRLGEAEFKLGRHDAAADAWRRAHALPDPARPAAPAGSPARASAAPIAGYAALGLARLALLRGDADASRQVLESATSNAPAFGPAFRLLGSAYAALGRTTDAERAVRIADRLPAYDPYVDPTIDGLVRESRSATFLLQQAAAADVGTNGAWREYLIRRALEFDPDNVDALYELASLLRVLRRYAEALELLMRYQRLVPDDDQALADTGRCLSGLQRYAEAEAVLRRALEGLDDANAHYDLGLVLDRSGRLPEAVTEYQRALDRHPTHRYALNNLGVALARQGRRKEATGMFERLVAADSDNADAHANLGAMYQSLGTHDLAAREFRAALEVNPDHAVAQDALTKTILLENPINPRK